MALALGLAACGMPEETRRVALGPQAATSEWPVLIERQAFEASFAQAVQTAGVAEGDIAGLQARILALRARARLLAAM